MINKNSFVIAVDGYASSGKSTLAKDLASKLNIVYIDTGAMYRAVTLYLLDKRIEISNTKEVSQALKDINILFKINKYNNKNEVYLNDENVEEKIRDLRVSSLVSEVSAMKEVRDILLSQQRSMVNYGSIVMDGRDIGTVVFPNADVKIFVYADEKERANRRYKELFKKNNNTKHDEVLENIRHRDHIDTTRKLAPLKQADDAIRIDNTDIDVKEQLKIALKHVQNKIK